MSGPRAARWWLPLAAGVGGLLAAVLLRQSLLADHQRHVALVAEAQTRSTAAQLQGGMRRLAGIFTGVAHRYGTALREDRPWDLHLTGLTAALWVEPTGKVGWASPREGNQRFAGADLSTNESARDAMRAAAATGQPGLSKSATQTPQDSVFHLVVPVMAGGRLEGFLIGVFSGNALYGAVLDSEAEQGWALGIFEGDRELYRRGSPLGGEWVAESEVKFLDGERRVRAAPSPAVLAALHSPLPTVVFAAGSAISLLFATAIGLAQSARRRAGEAEAAQAALVVGDQQLRAILDNTMAYVYVKDTLGRYLLLNRRMRELFGRPEIDLLGKTDQDLQPEPAAAQVRANDVTVLETGAPLQVEETVLLPDGLHTFLSVKVPLFDTTGVPHAVCAVSTDITEQKRYQELRERSFVVAEEGRRAREANRLKSEFLANMSHELRTPLNAIIGFAEILHDEKAGAVAPEQKEFLGDILASSRHLLQLINDVLDLAKVEAGKMEIHPEPLDPVSVAMEIRDVLRSLAASGRVTVSVERTGDVGEVVVDRAKLKQVLYNFLSNALKFTPEGGRVTIRVGPEGSSAFRVEVEDTGIGIRPEDIGRLFVEFQQLDAAGKYPGTGLGLALTKRIVEAQGGAVGAQARFGEGSVFFAVLPRMSTGRLYSPPASEGAPAGAAPPLTDSSADGTSPGLGIHHAW